MFIRIMALVIAGLALLLVPGASLAQDQAAPTVIDAEEPYPCPMPLPPGEIEGETIVCGQITVPEDWSNLESPPLTIAYARLFSTSNSPFADPILYFHGGPGGTVLGSLGGFNFDFPFLRSTRDIIYFDQRGNRYSSDLRCPAEVAFPDPAAIDLALAETPPYRFTADSDIEEAVTYYADYDRLFGLERCAEYFHEQGRDLSQYNTVNSVQDSIALMNYLGEPAYNLFGISYGTRLILSVLDYYEKSAQTDLPEIRSALIDGVSPPNQPGGWQGQALNAASAALNHFEACEADEACSAAYPDIHQRTIDLLASVAEKPLTLDDGTEITLADLAPVIVLPIVQKVNDAIPYLPRMIAELESGDGSTFRVVSGILNHTIALAESVPADTPFDPITAQTVAVAAELRALADRLDVIGEESIALTEAFSGVTSLPELYMNLLSDYLERAGEEGRSEFGHMLDNAIVGRPEKHTQAGLFNVSNSIGSPTVAQELISIANGMSEAEVVLVFDELTDDDFYQPLLTFDSYTNISVNCNDQAAFTDIAAYQERLRTFEAPQLLRDVGRDAAPDNIARCALLGLSPTESSEPPPGVVSDLPILIFTSMLDTQTPIEDGELAAETLTNADLLTFYRSGHGATRYTDCARDIANAFFTYPEVAFDSSCVAELEPDWVLPGDSLPAASAAQ